ncbi:MAG: diguanylate cyclase [Deltaproteobacteria bacterium]|nr:diguanylate cyclase [Deltaproteobacteria bacterium]
MATATESPAVNRLGRLIIPGLEVLELVGEGAFSHVYRARRGSTNVALKIQKDQHISLEARQRTWREAAALARLRHPSLCEIHTVDELDGRIYIVMEYVEGETLAEHMARGVLPESEARRIAARVADALAVVHRGGLVHGDVKPRNIILDVRGSPKIIDFGLATRAQGTEEAGNAFGTLLYASPEQLRVLKRPVDPRSDLYSLGALLYEMTTGVLPFESEDPADLLRMHATVTPASPRSINPALSEALSGTVLRLLAKDPDDRYQSASLLVSDLMSAPDDIVPVVRQEVRRHHGRAGSGDLPLAGRRVEVERILAAWGAARRSQGSTYLICGPGGSGKSRLARELVRAAEAESAVVLMAKCSAQDPLPFSSLRQLVGDLIAQVLASDDPDSTLRAAVVDAVGLGGVYLRRIVPEIAKIIPGLPTQAEERQIAEQLNWAAIQLFTQLATNLSGLVLVVDDVQWLDDATCRMFERLDSEITGRPLLFLATARTGPENAEAIASFRGLVRSSLAAETDVGILAPEFVEDLVKNYLHTEEVTTDILDRLCVRSAGNALAVLENLQVLIDTGCVRYAWGHWRLSELGIGQVVLPEHIMNVITGRLAGLGRDVESTLAVAAMLGTRFDRETLRLIQASSKSESESESESALSTDAADSSDSVVDDAIERAVANGVIERVGGRQYAFVHDRLREALLSVIPEAERPSVHLRIARAIESLSEAKAREGDANVSANVSANVEGGTDDLVSYGHEEKVYALAHHYYSGRSPRVAARGFRANWMAAKAAHHAYAFEQAYSLYVAAEEMARLSDDVEIPCDYLFDRGRLCVATWRNEEANRCLTQASEASDDRLLRASSFFEQAKTQLADADRAQTYVSLALGEFDAPYVYPTVARATRTLAGWLWGLLFPGSPLTASQPRQTAQARLVAECYEHAGFVEFYSGHALGMFQAPFASRYYAARLGVSSLRARWYGSTASMASVIGFKRVARVLRARAKAMATVVADPATLGSVALFCGYSLDYDGLPAIAAESHKHTLDTYRKWMPPFDAESCLGTLVPNLFMRGHIREIVDALERAFRERWTRGDAESRAETGRGELLYQIMLMSARRALDSHAIASTEDIDVAWNDASQKQSGFFRGRCLGYMALDVLFSGADLARIDDLVALFLAEALNLKTNHQVHVFTVAEIWIRLRQLEAAPENERAEVRERYGKALERLRLGSHHPTVRSHFAAAEAKRFQIEGDLRRHRKFLNEAERLATTHDNRWVLFEVGMMRADDRSSVRPQGTVQRIARTMVDFAVAQGVVAWVKRTQARFDVEAAASMRLSVASRSRVAIPVDTSGLHASRSLSALLQVSLASTMVLDPDRQARVVLDEIVRLLGAERALLFLADEDEDEDEDARSVRLAAGRTKEGDDVLVSSGYSTSVLDDVLRTRRAVVIGGFEDQKIQVSESVIAHDLRSIMAAPLLLRDRLIGIVYADNTLARGMFTGDDVSVFSAIASHVAIAIETAKTARLEAEVEAERAQRQLAEHLSSVVSSLGSTLELREVLENLLDHMTHVAAYRRAAILLRRGDGLHVAAHRGFDAQAIDPQRVVTLDECRESGDLLSGEEPIVLRQRFPYPYGAHVDDGDVLLAIPLLVRGALLGLLTLQLERSSEEDAHKVQVATMFAGHAAIAVENARLFEEVRQQAITDSLTGLYTRRHFFSLAEREVALARRKNRALSVLMVDVDHFKKVNDTYGHGVGDQVLIETAARLRKGVRETDILGRYGGEEFCIVLVDSGAADGDGSARPDLMIAERLRRLIADTPMETELGPVSATISLGLAANRDAALSAEALLSLADAALYKAKSSGRNRVVVHGEHGEHADEG